MQSPDVTDRLARPEESGLDRSLLVPLMKLLAAGESVEPNRLADTIGQTEASVRRSLAAVPDTEYDAEGRIVGQGLTLRPTPHQFTVAGRHLYTWCAFDTLFFPALLDQAAQIASTTPVDRHTVHVAVEPHRLLDVEPKTAVVSLVNPDDMTSIRTAFCNHVHYFATEDEGQTWRTTHPDADLVPVNEAHELGRNLTAQFLDPHQQRDDHENPCGCNC